MEQLKGKFVPQFKLRQPQMTTWLLSKRTKRNSLLVVSMFREGFPDSYCRWRALEVHCNNDQSIHQLAVSKGDSSKLPELLFNRLQLSDQEYCGLHRRNFGHFVAREAVLDEEYWTAAWLRAEAHWESVSYMRHIDTYKRKYAEQEFYALKRRCCGQEGNSLKCFCFVAHIHSNIDGLEVMFDVSLSEKVEAILQQLSTIIKSGCILLDSLAFVFPSNLQLVRELLSLVKKEEKNARRTVLNSVVGTLDLSVRQFVQGEMYPGEVKRLSAVLAYQEPFDAHKYAYIANVCVSKFARRQAIASNMLYLATDMATSEGMKQLFVHVNVDNKPAQELYKKTGFKIVSVVSTPLSKDQRLLMSMELQHTHLQEE